MIQVLKGMKDIYFEDMEKYDFIISTATNVLKKYGYSRINTPILEELDLFKRSVGDETDVVSKEMYTFTDKGGRNVALRPEGTAGTVRAYLEAKLYNSNPNTKWFYYGTMYRYEAPQKGRFREFNQLGVENFGTRSPLVDAEMIAMSIEFLEKVGITDIIVEVNSLGNKESRLNYINSLKNYLMDNFDKLSEVSKVRAHKNPLRVLDSKEDDEIVANAPSLYDFFDEESSNYFKEVLKYLDSFGIKYTINNKLVRGLDYYSDTVFEIKSKRLDKAILGGGRYDKLMEILADKKVPAIGFAAGIERVMMLIDTTLLPKKLEKVYIAYFEETKEYLIEVLKIFKNLNVEINYEYSVKGFSAQMKKANKINANRVIILGEDEMNKKSVSIKNFETGEQKLVLLNELEGEF